MTAPDLHMHSDFSCDCQTPMAQMCRAALTVGLSEIGFSDHYDLMPEDPCYDFFRVEAWWKELERCRAEFGPELTIRAGVELGEPHRFTDEMAALLSAFPWDYSLGSLHWVGDQLIFRKPYFERSPDQAYREYFHEMNRMAAEADFDILAHLDVIKRLGFEQYGFYDAAAYEEEIRAVLRTCAQRGRAVEINTSTLRRSVNQTAPEAWVLDWFAEEGGQWVTFGSDAHEPGHIGYGLEQVSGAARQAGFETLATFERRSAQLYLTAAGKTAA
jgi:histidinol-phosphatase (PHP family)